MFKTTMQMFQTLQTRNPITFISEVFLTIARQFFFFIKVSSLLFCTAVLADTSNTPNPVRWNESIQNADCIDFINENASRVSCGFIELPLNHDEPGNKTVTLPVLIAGQTQTLSNNPSSRAILIPGGGGPGGPMGFGYQYSPGDYLREYSSLRAAGFDIVIVDQRGAGYAKPNLRCTETSTAFKRSVVIKQTFKQDLAAYNEAITACGKRIQNDNIELIHFDTYQSAKDFMTIMDSLPYTSWNTLATSYATVIAQAIEVLEPQRFDRIVLDSPVPIDFQQPFTVESSISSVNRILTLCEETRRCNKRHPKIKEKLQTVLSRATKKPYSVKIKVADESQTARRNIKLIVSHTTLIDILITAAYNNYAITEIPSVIDQLYKGRARSLRQFAEDYWFSGSDLDFADALSWAIHCKERIKLEEAFLLQNPGSDKEYSEETKLAMEQERKICKKLNVGTDNKIKTDKIFKTRTLILAGDLDPVISRRDISNTADNFSNATTTIIAGMGHSVWFQSACTRKNTLDFFLSSVPATSPTPATCTDGINRFK